MQRREFIASSALLGLASALNSKELKEVEPKTWLVLDEVLLILFPKTETMPSSKEFAAIKYFQEALFSKYFPKDDQEYILQGAVDFYGSFSDFLDVNKKTKEEYVKAASLNNYGSSWLEQLVYYGIEAMLSDPIYGGNKNEIAWKSLNHQSGKPQSKYKYAKVV